MQSVPQELIKMIFYNLSWHDKRLSARSHKAIRGVCLAWRDCADSDPQVIHMRDRLCNHLVTLLNMYPDAAWDWEHLIRNPNITIEYIISQEGHQFNRIDGESLTINPAFTWTDIQNNPTLPWCEPAFVFNPNFTFDIVLNNPDIEFNAEDVSAIVTQADIVNHPEYPWHWPSISCNKSITFAFVKNAAMQNIHFEWESLSRCLKWSEIKNNLDDPIAHWNWYHISHNPSVTFDDVCQCTRGNWHWDILLRHNVSAVTNFVMKYSTDEQRNTRVGHTNYHINWHLASVRVPWSYISTHTDQTTHPWIYDYVIRNPTVTWANICATISTYPWNVQLFIHNSNATFTRVKKIIKLHHGRTVFTRIALSRFGKK